MLTKLINRICLGFQNAEDGVYSDIWRGITSSTSNFVSSVQEGINKTQSEKYAFIGEKTALLSASAGSCDLGFMKEEFFKSGFGFAMKEGWPFTKYFDKVYVLAFCVVLN